LDSRLSMTDQVNEICRLSFFHSRALRHIRPSLKENLANTIACSLVHSRLDYCNSLLASLSQGNMPKLQRVQNNLSKIVLNKRSFSSLKSLKKLHWLPVKQSVEYKTASLVHKVLRTGEPQYLAAYLHNYQPTRNLRSSTLGLLDTPRHLSVAGSFSFQHYAPDMWNCLPPSVRNEIFVPNFNKLLKTYLFDQTFSTV